MHSRLIFICPVLYGSQRGRSAAAFDYSAISSDLTEDSHAKDRAVKSSDQIILWIEYDIKINKRVIILRDKIHINSNQLTCSGSDFVV